MTNKASNKNISSDQGKSSYQEKQPQAKQTAETTKNQQKASDESYMRLLANFENFKKSTEKDQQYWLTHIKKSLLVNLLPVLDDFELALKHQTPKETSTKEQGISYRECNFISV